MQHLNENARLKEVIAAANSLAEEVIALTDTINALADSTNAETDQKTPAVDEGIAIIGYAEQDSAPTPQYADVDPLATNPIVWQRSHSGDVFRRTDNATGEMTQYVRHTLPEEGKIALGLA